MYLDLISGMGEGPAAEQIRRMQAAGQRVPGVVCLLAFRPGWTRHLNAFVQCVMREPGELPPWQRELIAALTSRHNHCVF